MTDYEALLAAICLHPRDDVPRLVMVDWLEEHGQAERAEFIRVQVELARTPSPEVYVELQRRKRELLDAHLCDWVPLSWHQGSGAGIRVQHDSHASVVEFTGCWLHAAIFKRGFIEWLSCSWSDFLSHHEKLIWSPEQTEMCLECSGGMVQTKCGMGHTHYVPCSACNQVGRIPRPFPGPTVQPIERVELTTRPNAMDNDATTAARLSEETATFTAHGYTFTRVKCPTCNSTNRVFQQTVNGLVTTSPCSACHGRPPNSWRCVLWPGVEFVMPPEAAEATEAQAIPVTVGASSTCRMGT